MKPRTFTQQLTHPNNDEILMCVEYTYTPGAPEQGPSYASGGQPADPPEVEIVNCWNQATGKAAELTREDHALTCELLIENHVDDGPDPDDARDAREDRVEFEDDWNDGYD
jgi:hypothetical protein